MKTLIESAGHSQKSLAKAIGVSYSLVQYYVAGEREPTFSKACAIAEALDCPLKTLARALNIDVRGIPDDVPVEEEEQ